MATSEFARLVVLTSRVGADEKRLFEEFDRRSVGFEQADPRRAFYELGGTRLPASGHGGRRVVVLNREIGQVRALYAARSLEAAGSTVVNSAAATNICGDKWLTSITLHAAGLPTPRTSLALTPDAAIEAIEAIGYPAVIKPLVGSWGRLVVPVPDPLTARSILDYVLALPSPQSHLVYVQELVDKPDRDIRAIVVGGEVVGAIYRRATGLRTNVALGADVEVCPLTPELCALARTAAHAVGADIAGVDLIEDADGETHVLEVNHRVEFGGFQRAHGSSGLVAARIADHLMTYLDTSEAALEPVTMEE